MRKIWIVLLLVMLLEPWLVSIVACEIQTAVYIDEEIVQACNDNSYGSFSSIKILNCRPYQYCRVYGKNDDYGAILLLRYEYTDSESDVDWRIDYIDVMWAKSGNADEYVWPYIR